MMRKAMKRLLQIVLIPLIGGFIGLALLAAAFMLPGDRIYSHVKQSVPMLEKETAYFSVTPTIKGTRLDNYTEAAYLNEALVSLEDAPLTECMLSGYVLTLPGFTGNPVERLSTVISNSEEAMLSAAHFRFFNGYITVLKPLLLLTDYSGIRQFNLYICLFLTLLFLYAMLKRGLAQYVLPVVISVLFIHPVTIALNMTFFGFYLCMIIPSIIILLTERGKVVERAWLLFGITGAATFYFNMNYFQLLCFAVPILFYFLIVGVPKKTTTLIWTIAYYLFVWLAGYAGMMLFKWIIYATLDKNVFRRMFEAFLTRTDTDRGSRFYGISVNMEVVFSNIWLNIIETAFVIFSCIKLKTNKVKAPVTLTRLVLLAVMITLPIGRYFILSNHVIIHNWVTYRLLMIPILTFNLLITRRWCNNGFEEV